MWTALSTRIDVSYGVVRRSRASCRRTRRTTRYKRCPPGSPSWRTCWTPPRCVHAKPTSRCRTNQPPSPDEHRQDPLFPLHLSFSLDTLRVETRFASLFSPGTGAHRPVPGVPPAHAVHARARRVGGDCDPPAARESRLESRAGRGGSLRRHHRGFGRRARLPVRPLPAHALRAQRLGALPGVVQVRVHLPHPAAGVRPTRPVNSGN